MTDLAPSCRLRLAGRGRRLLAALLLVPLLLACEGGRLADNGGMSGTGVSDGSITAFGSIFVGAVQWDLTRATIEIDGAPATEGDLRVGMVVRVEGDFDPGNTTGSAIRVRFDPELVGPIEGAPVETIPGVTKTFSILGRTVIVNANRTIFAGGADFATLASDDVLEVSGHVTDTGGVRATRVLARGVFPAIDTVETSDVVSNLTKNPDGSGLFDLGPITVRYTPTTPFEDTTRMALTAGDRVDVEGTLRLVGDEIDATRIRAEDDGLAARDLARAEIEGIVRNCPAAPDFCVRGIRVDASGAVFDPPGFTPMRGDRVEIEGSVVAGLLIADRIEDEEDAPVNARLEGEVTAVDLGGGRLTLLGVDVIVDGNTILRDDSVVDDESFTFPEILVGDFLKVRGVETSGDVRARFIRRDDATAGDDDVRLQGPVTALDTLTPSLSILGQAVPLDAGTLYFDRFEAPRTEEEFFRNPGDVLIGDIVAAKDEDATDLAVLGEADEVGLED